MALSKLFFSVAIGFWLFGFAHAQGLPSQLTVTRSVKTEIRPTYMKVTVTVEGRSGVLPKAIAELKKRVEKSKERFGKLGAEPQSIVVSEPSISGASNPNDAQRMQELLNRYGGGDRGRKMLEKVKSVSVLQEISAKWKLADSEDDYQRLIDANELRAKIEAADLGCANDPQPVTPEQAELAEEMQALLEEYSYGQSVTQAAGELKVEYIASVPAEEVAGFVKQAFDIASEEFVSLQDAIGGNKAVTMIYFSISNSNSSSPEIDRYYRAEPNGTTVEQEQDGNYTVVSQSPLATSVFISATVAGK